MKILFVSSRNIYNSTGEMRLVKSRSNVLDNAFGIHTDYICYRDKSIFDNPQEFINPKSSFELFTYSMFNPFSIEKQKRDIVKRVKEIVSDYDAVIISGELVLSLVDIIKKIKNIPVIYDIHGVCDELKEFKSDSLLVNVKRKIIYNVFQKLENKYIKKYDAAFVVTEELRDHVIKKYDAGNLKYFIIPCSKNQYNLDKSNIEENREKYRLKYKVEKNDILFIYSGGYSPWQCIDETIELFHKINERIPNSKLLILSGDIDKINTKNYNNIIKDSLSYDLVDPTLCAGDFAFMLRGDFVTNHVAFPNKYCEYLASGMKIISSPYLYTISRSIRENNVGLVLSNNSDLDSLLKYIKENNTFGTDIETRQLMLDKICFDKTVEAVYKYLKGGCNEQ